MDELGRSADRAEKLRRNPRLIFWKSFFHNGLFLNPILALFMISRGATEAEVFKLTLIYSVITILTEIPTGYLGDFLGRRRTLLVGAAVMFLGSCLQVFAQGFLMLAVTRAMHALAHAFDSGTEEALIVDSSRELGEKGKLIKNASIGRSGRHLIKFSVLLVFIVFAAFLSGKELYLYLALLVAVSHSCVFIPLIFVEEPKRSGKVSFRKAFATLREFPILWIFTVHDSLRFTGMIIFWTAYPVILKNLGMSFFALGVCYAIFHFGLYLHELVAWRLEARFGAAKIVNSASFACLIFSPLVVLANQIWFVAAAVILIMVLGSMGESYYIENINRFITSDNRAVTLSLMNMSKRILEVPILLLAVWAAESDIRYVIYVFALINILLLLVPYPSREKVEAARDN